MNLIDRYITEIGKHLPQKSRLDIEKEIRSNLEDMLEDRSRTAGKPADEAMTVEVLKEFGSPQKVAASYTNEQYLIGPRLFPIFWMVTRIVLAVLGALALVGFGIGVVQSGTSIDGLVNVFGKSLAEFFGAAMSAFGNIVLVFFILERFVPKLSFDEKEDETWDPSSLPEVADSDKLSITETIVEIVVTVAAFIIFNFYPDALRIAFLEDGKWTFIPVLSQTFFSYLPYMNALWGLQVVLNAFLLRDGRWRPATRWADAGRELLGVALAYFMLKGPALVSITTDTLLSANPAFTPETAGMIASIIQQAPRLALILAIIVGMAEVAKNIYRILTAKK